MAEMSKTPEEIKMLLASWKHYIFDQDSLNANALAYIQRLETDNAKKDETIQMLQDGNASLMNMIDEECKKTVRLERERDAAVKILTDIVHITEWFGDVDICSACKKDNCKECREYNEGFEWRGVQEQPEGDEHGT